MLKRFIAITLVALAAVVALPAAAQPTTKCGGKFVNPVTDVCWSCLFPLSVGGMKVWKGDRPDTSNPTSPICACGGPPRIGIAIGFWEPSRLVDVTAKPWCFPNLGGMKLDPGFDIGMGQSQQSRMQGGQGGNTAKWHAHYYVYPLLYWLEILTDFLCFEQSSFDIAYITEIDPLWNDDQLSTLINPEAALFANPIAVAACTVDCAASTAKLPIDQMFWCAGCNGQMYPMNGNVSHNVGVTQSSRLVAERLLYKMHRQGLAWGTAGPKALCGKYLMPILKRSQYRIQMTNPTPTVKGRLACAPLGASTLPPSTGRMYPVGGEDFGYLIWRKRNCCML